MEQETNNNLSQEQFDSLLGYEAGQSSSASESSRSRLTSEEGSYNDENTSENQESLEELEGDLVNPDEDQIESLALYNRLFEDWLQIERFRLAITRRLGTRRARNQQQTTTNTMAQQQPTAVETLFLGGNISRTAARNDDELIATVTSCAKGDRATLKQNDKKAYEKLKESCCTKLANAIFELIKPIDSKTAASQLKEVTSVVAKVNALKKRLRTDDTIDVFTIPKDMELDATTNYWLPSANTATRIL